MGDEINIEDIQFPDFETIEDKRYYFVQDIARTLQLLNIDYKKFYKYFSVKQLLIQQFVNSYNYARKKGDFYLFNELEYKVPEIKKEINSIFNLLISNDDIRRELRSFQFDRSRLKDSYHIIYIIENQNLIIEFLEKIRKEYKRYLGKGDYEKDLFLWPYGQYDHSERLEAEKKLIDQAVAKLEAWNLIEKKFLDEMSKGLNKGIKQIISFNHIPVEIIDGIYTRKGPLNSLCIGGIVNAEELNKEGLKYTFPQSIEIGKDFPFGRKATLIYREQPNSLLSLLDFSINDSRKTDETNKELARQVKSVLIKHNKIAFILQIEVLSKFKNEGLAKALIDVALWEIKQKGLEMIFSIVMEDNPERKKILKVFEKMGFKIIETSYMNDVYEDIFYLVYKY